MSNGPNFYPPFIQQENTPDPATGIYKLSTNAASLAPTKRTVNAIIDYLGSLSSGGGLISVENIVALRSLDTADVATGQPVFVETTKCFWYAFVEPHPSSKPNPSTEDGITIVRSVSDTVTYYRDTATARPFLSVEEWFINNGAASGLWGAGNDENSGTTKDAPLASIAELNRRTHGMSISDPTGGYFMVRVGPSGCGAGTLDLTCGCDFSAEYSETWTKVGEGTVHDSVALSRSTNTPQSVNMDAGWEAWDSGRMYRNTANNDLSVMRQIVAGTGGLKAETNFASTPNASETIEAYTLPQLGADAINANGNYVGVVGVTYNPQWISGAYFYAIQCVSNGSTEIRSCYDYRAYATDFVTALKVSGFGSSTIYNSVLRAETLLGISNSSSGTDHNGGGNCFVTGDSAILAPIQVSGGYRLIVGGVTDGSAAIGSVYIANGGKFILGPLPAASFGYRNATGAQLDFGVKAASSSYLYGTSVDADAMLQIKSTNCYVTYMDTGALKAVRNAQTFPWSLPDPGAVTNPLTGTAASLPAGSAATVKNPVGIFPRA